MTATKPNALKGYDDVTNILREAQNGVVLGNPNAQAIFSLFLRNVRADIEIGYLFGGGDAVKVKLPLAP